VSIGLPNPTASDIRFSENRFSASGVKPSFLVDQRVYETFDQWKNAIVQKPGTLGPVPIPVRTYQLKKPRNLPGSSLMKVAAKL